MKFLNEKIDSLLEANSLKVEHRYNKEKWKGIFVLYLQGKEIGKCEIREDGYFIIDRIDIDDEFQNKGYGTLLLYKVLLEIEKLINANIEEIDEEVCRLAGFPSNCSFYFRAGFTLLELEGDAIDKWYQLSLEDKKEQIYLSENHLKLNKKDFFEDGDCEISMIFDFKNQQAVEEINRALDNIEYGLCLSFVINEFMKKFARGSPELVCKGIEIIASIYCSFLAPANKNKTENFLKTLENEGLCATNGWYAFFGKPIDHNINKEKATDVSLNKMEI